MNPVVTGSRQPNRPETPRDMDQPKLNPVYISVPVSNNVGPNHPPRTAVGQLTDHRAVSVAVLPALNADGPGH